MTNDPQSPLWLSCPRPDAGYSHEAVRRFVERGESLDVRVRISREACTSTPCGWRTAMTTSARSCRALTKCGQLGAILGDEEVVVDVGSVVFKPRGQWHTFWNAAMGRFASWRSFRLGGSSELSASWRHSAMPLRMRLLISGGATASMSTSMPQCRSCSATASPSEAARFCAADCARAGSDEKVRSAR